jgi:hypothetical protein
VFLLIKVVFNNNNQPGRCLTLDSQFAGSNLHLCWGSEGGGKT